MKQLLQLPTRIVYHVQLILSIVFLILSLWVANPALATSLYEMPTLQAGEPTWVIDKDEVLSRVTEGQISSALEKLAEKTGNEVRFVTIHRLDYGETTQSFTDKLFEKWFPTPEEQANQTLLVLDTMTNTAGIRTGEKVKTLLSDTIATSVANETLLTPLKQGNKYNQAFLDACERLVAVLSGEPDPGAPQIAETLNVESTFKSAEETDRNTSAVIVIVLLVAATVIPMVTYFWYQGFSN